ncbi:DUF6701 domain-containing protein [Aliagarivorans marinus]|uniref:DUF6701 domain-containing protein n=1 Tax=Aliagarivorans marinus TaxID=561965 RepID=UPI000416670E|nr:DUF6701 domain-containing protein [Aliagarivorans marinus]
MQYLTPCFALLLTYFVALSTWASSPDQVFVDGVAITDPSKMIQFEAKARLLNSPSNNLYTYRLQDRSDDNGIPSHKRSCGDVWCSKRDQVIASLALPDFSQCRSSSNESHVINSGGSATLAQGEYQNVILNSGAKLEFTTSGGAYRMQDLIVNGGAKLTFSTGRYWLNSLTINSGGKIELPNSGLVQIFVNNNLVINGSANLNKGGDPNNLLIASYGSVNVNNPNSIAGYIYAEDNILINGNNVQIEGGLVGAQVQLMSNVDVTYRAPQLDDLWQPDCDNGAPLHLQYGRSYFSGPSGNGATVIFDQPYEETPLVFVMTPIDASDPNGDGPVAALLDGVSTTGFNWVRQEPPRREGSSYTPSKNIEALDWIAISPGDFTLADGRRIVAKAINTRDAVGLGGNRYTDVDLDFRPDVLLNQLQSRSGNNCWFTATSLINNDTIRLAVDPSEVYENQGGRRCQEGGYLRDELVVDETIGYLATTSGQGVLTANGKSVPYLFGTASTASGDPSRACQTTHSFPSGLFNSTPLLVAGKNSRNGGNGGWLRRCQHSASEFSMVIEEDQYRDFERNHIPEGFSFVALEQDEIVGIPDLEISAPSLGLSCDIHEITLRATLDGQTDQSFLGNVVLSTDTNRGIWSTIDADGSLTPASQTDNGSANYQFVASDQGEVTLGLFHSPEGDVEITVADGALNASTTVRLSAYGLRGELVSTQDWGSNPHIANEPFSLTLTAVGKDESGADCSPLTNYAGSKNIAFWTDYQTPNSGSRLLSVNDTAVGASEADRVTLAVTFSDGESEAIALHYNDAGRLAINYWDEVGSIVDDATVTLRGSDSADILPEALVWIGVQSSGGNANPGGTATTGDKFVPAGEAFSGRLQAITANCSSAVTNEDCWAISFVSDLEASIGMSLETPTGGASGTVYIAENFPSWGKGGLSFDELSWGEVGSIVLSGEVDLYLGWDVGGANSDDLGLRLRAEQSVGRFYPAYYELLAYSGSLATVNPGCDLGGFTYTGARGNSAQHLAWRIEARNAASKVVSNYTLGRYSVGRIGENWSVSSTSLSARFWVDDATSAENDTDGYAINWQEGVIEYPPSGAVRGLESGITKNQTDEEEPILDAVIQHTFIGPDGSVLRSQAKIDDSSTGFVCDGLGMCELDLMPELRHGQIYAPNSFGSELQSILVQPELQYFVGGRYQQNSQDTCSEISSSDLMVAPSQDGAPLVCVLPVDGVSSILSIERATADKGIWSLLFAVPQGPVDADKTGQCTYTINNAVFPWLSPATGEVSFGWFRQNDRVIFRRSL